MFRSLSGERHLSGGQSSSSPTGHGVTSPGLDNQESSWIGLLSRPAISFLQKYLPGRPRNPAVSDRGAGWISGDLKTSFVEEESEFLRQLDDTMPLTQHPGPHLTYLRCQRDGAADLLEPGGGSTLPWLSADSLREIGIQNSEEMDLNLCQQTPIGYFSSARTFLSHVWLNAVTSQEIKPTGGKDWAKSSGGKSRWWWGSFWGGEESSPTGLLSWAEEGAVTGRLCPQQPVAETKAPAAQTTDVFVQSGGRGWTLGENTGPADHKEEPANNGGLQTVQNTEGSTPDHRLSISNHLSSSGAAAACSEVALPTPDQDNGYSSLEEEHFQMCHLYMVEALSEGQQEPGPTETSTAVRTEMEEETSEEGESTSGKVDEEEGTQEDEEEQEAAAQEGQSAAAAAAVLTTPQCQNKAIAFIIGCPCSDDDSSQSGGESSDEDEDDDGFDSDLSDSTDEDDEDDGEDSDSEADSEADRLWTSLCQSLDPYNPRNFTARLHTSSTPPRTLSSTPPSSTQSTPASSPDLTLLPLSSLADSPPSGPDVWDDSTSASEVDEAESLRLWSSFNSSSDPYSPFNFQAPLSTRVSVEAGPQAKARSKKASQTPSRSPHHNPASPPEYRKEEAEERLDSGFSEPSSSSTSSSSASSQSCSTTKKVSLFSFSLSLTFV